MLSFVGGIIYFCYRFFLLCIVRFIVEFRGIRWVGNRLRMRIGDGSLARVFRCCGCIRGLV